MLFAAHVNVTAFHQQVQGQASKYDKSNNQFPHDDFFPKKKALDNGEGLG